MEKPQLLPSDHEVGSVERTREMFEYYDKLAEYWDNKIGKTSNDDICTKQWERCCRARDTFFNILQGKLKDNSLAL